VLCIGAGGLGSPVAMYLAAAGVGTLGMVDFDVVDFSNLQRQILHGTSDVGRSKLDSARDRLTDINPLIKIVSHDTAISSENALELFAPYDIIVDALFGTGLTRPLEGIYLQVVQHLSMIRNARERSSTVRPFILSLDLPSGLNADLANPIGDAVQADLTVTFTAPKPANVLPPVSHFGGELVIANIGSPISLLDAARPALFLTEAGDAREWLVSTRYTPDSYKNTHGHALIIAGSRGYSGAAALCGNAAMRSGAGLVTIATPVSAQMVVDRER